MNHYLESVEKFHKSFNHPIEDNIIEDNIDIRKLRLKLLFEELEELSNAMGTDDTFHELCQSTLNKGEQNTDNYDKVETLDALCDIQYVLSGAVLAMGYKNVFDEAFDEVQRSNMSKMCEDLDTAQRTVDYYKKERGEELPMNIVPKGNKYIVVRQDKKILKSINYSPTDLKKYVE